MSILSQACIDARLSCHNLAKMRDMSFGERLNKLSKKRGISDAELTRQVGGVTSNTVRRWLSGEIQPRLDQAIRAAAVFGMRLDQLAYDDARPTAGELSEEEQFLLRSWRILDVDADTAVRWMNAMKAKAMKSADEPTSAGEEGSPAKVGHAKLIVERKKPQPNETEGLPSEDMPDPNDKGRTPSKGNPRSGRSRH